MCDDHEDDDKEQDPKATFDQMDKDYEHYREIRKQVVYKHKLRGEHQTTLDECQERS